MKYTITKRTISSGVVFIVSFIAAVYFAYLWVAEGMPLLTNKYGPGSQKSMLPIIGGSIVCLLISVVAAIDAYVYSKNDEKQ